MWGCHWPAALDPAGLGRAVVVELVLVELGLAVLVLVLVVVVLAELVVLLVALVLVVETKGEGICRTLGAPLQGRDEVELAIVLALDLAGALLQGEDDMAW